MFLPAIVACMTVAAPEGIRPEVCGAYVAWAPAIPEAQVIRWCAIEDCPRIDGYGGGIYDVQSKTVILSRNRVDQMFMKPEDWGRLTRSQEVYLLLVHELGHSMGLDHSPHGVMRQGWDEITFFPDETDRMNLRIVKISPLTK